jgi:hypothetical protein
MTSRPTRFNYTLGYLHRKGYSGASGLLIVEHCKAWRRVNLGPEIEVWDEPISI